jgi:hypothetical protein
MYVGLNPLTVFQPSFNIAIHSTGKSVCFLQKRSCKGTELERHYWTGQTGQIDKFFLAFYLIDSKFPLACQGVTL